MKIEVAVQDVSGALTAAGAGAERIELCTGLPLGGLTPSAGLIANVLRHCPTLETHVLIRPRPGDFCYSEYELETICADIRHAVSAGAAGVVVGALSLKGTVDATALTAFRQAAGAAELTFHRAIDHVTDVVGAIRKLQDYGVDRVLSSGGARSVRDGLGRLEVMRLAATGLTIMAGGGARLTDLRPLKNIGIDDVHLSAKREQAPVGSAPGAGPVLGASTAGPAGAAAAGPPSAGPAGVRAAGAPPQAALVPGLEPFGHQVTDREQVLAAVELARSL